MDSKGIQHKLDGLEEYHTANMTNDSFVAYFTLRISHMFGAQAYDNVTEEGIFEIFRQELESYVIHPWTWIEVDLKVPFYAYLVPFLAVLSLMVTGVVIFIFIKEKLFSPINILIMAIAICDTLTVVLPVPFLIYIYSSPTAPFVPYSMCRYFDYIGKYIPEITHTASIWLTLNLSFQRFISVCKPFYAKRICTRKTSLRMILIVSICAIFIHLSRFLDTKYITVVIHDMKENIVTCQGMHVETIANYSTVYECAYYWTVIIVVKLIPFASTITFDILMATRLRRSEIDRRQFSSIDKMAEARKRKESFRVTRIIIIVTIVIVMVEIPLMVTLILWTLTMIHKRLFIPETMLGKLSVIFNLMIYISFPSILLLYCGMSHKFRRRLFKLFCYCRKGIRRIL